MKIKNDPLKYVLVILVVMIIQMGLTAQDTKKIFDYPGSRIIWYGVDFSQVKLIAEHVKQYDTEQQDGIGLVFIMESLDKPTETGTMWVTFFDPANRQVILTERMSGLAGGFGFRNHWARTVYNVINEIKVWKYQEWKRRYERSNPVNDL